jgi:CHASE3 domain sensor protein
MTTITFDTLDLVDKLKTAGIPQAQAEAVVRVIAEAQDGLVTKHDLTEVKNEIKAEINVRFERIDGELKLNRWMLGVLLAGVISLVLKAFF